MIPFPVFAWMYVLLGLGLAVVWPVFLSGISPALGPVGLALFMLNLVWMVFTWRKCSSVQLSYWRGLSIIAASMMSGCANITIIYAPFVVFGVYYLSAGYAFLGLFRSQPPASERWFKLVLRLADRDSRSDQRSSGTRLPPSGPGPQGL